MSIHKTLNNTFTIFNCTICHFIHSCQLLQPREEKEAPHPQAKQEQKEIDETAILHARLSLHYSAILCKPEVGAPGKYLSATYR